MVSACVCACMHEYYLRVHVCKCKCVGASPQGAPDVLQRLHAIGPRRGPHASAPCMPKRCQCFVDTPLDRVYAFSMRSPDFQLRRIQQG